jgi:hypothetical protein
VFDMVPRIKGEGEKRSNDGAGSRMAHNNEAGSK